MDTPFDSPAKLRFGNFEADLRSAELRKGGAKIKLQEQPFQVLAALLRHPGEMVTREELRTKLWPDGIHVDYENGLNIAVKKLRQALGDDAEIPKFIETLPRRGYRFIAPICIEPSNPPSPASSNSVEALSAPRATAAGGSGHANQKRRAWLAPGASFLLIAAITIAGVIAWRSTHSGAVNRGAIRSIAVLPLQNLSGDASQEYFADGMTEELVTDLAQIRGLRVISRTSSMSYKGTQKTIPVIARELNVDGIIEGAVARSGGRVRITAQLIEAAQDKHLWAANYERDLRDVLGVQDRVAREIAEQVRIHLTPEEQRRLRRPRPVNPRAYEAYLKGRFYANKLTQSGLDTGVAYFRQAAAIDPKYAPAYAGVAFYYLAQADWMLSPLDALPKARAAAEMALRLDDSLADAYADLGFVHFWYEWDWPAAERAFRRALAINPNDAKMHAYYAACLAWTGKSEEAIAEAKKAVTLDPVSLEAARTLGEVYYFSRRYGAAITQLRDAVAMDREYWFAHMSLGRAYLAKGQTPKAIAELQLATKLAPDNPDPLSALGNAYAVAGKRNQAQAIVTRLKEISKAKYVAPYDFAIVYAGLGEPDRALAALRDDQRERSIYVTWLRTDPVLDPLRRHPEFQRLRHRTGLN